jgi:hypothetical protein
VVVAAVAAEVAVVVEGVVVEADTLAISGCIRG